MADDYFTKAEKIKQKVRNLDWEKKIKLLEKDFEDKKFSKEEFLDKKRQVYSEVLDQMSEINQEKMKLNKDHSAEPIEDDYLSDEDLEIFQEQLTPFQYMSLTKDYLGEFDSQDIVFSDDFRKFENLENFVHWECVKKIEKLRIHNNYFSCEFMDKNELVIKDIACLNELSKLEELVFDDEGNLGDRIKVDYFSSKQLSNIKQLEIHGLWDLSFLQNSFSDNHNIYETLEIIKNDLKTLERAVYSGSIEATTSTNEQSNIELDSNSEDVLTRHLLKLSEVEDQFRQLTNKFEEINFKLDKLSNRLSKIQADNQIRFQDIESAITSGAITTQLSSKPKTDSKSEILPGSSQPQDLGSISYKDTETSETSQQIQSVNTTATVLTETFQAEEKILPQELSPKKQYEFATSFLKVGDYSTAERAFREFVLSNSEHELAGSAQYWYAETFRIRQLYTDAASAYLEGYQKYPKGNKAPINLLKLGVSMVQIGEKDQGCKMINGVELQYPKANQSVIQKAKYESKKFECIKEDS